MRSEDSVWEVLVTAQKRQERPLNVPVPVSEAGDNELSDDDFFWLRDNAKDLILEALLWLRRLEEAEAHCESEARAGLRGCIRGLRRLGFCVPHTTRDLTYVPLLEAVARCRWGFSAVGVPDRRARGPPGCSKEEGANYCDDFVKIQMDLKALKKHISKTIRSRREELGLSQIELGKHIDLSESTVSRIEREEYLPTLEKLLSLAQALRIHPMILLQGDDLTMFVESLSPASRVELREALGRMLAAIDAVGR